MKTLTIKFLTIALALAIALPLLAVNPELERKLVEKAMLEGATTKEQRVAVLKYISGERKKMAATYREASVVSHGGKAVSQEAQKRRLVSIAEELEKEAVEYETTANAESQNPNFARK